MVTASRIDMSERCMVCKYNDGQGKENTSKSTFYINNSGKDIHLCGIHSRELFLEGQINFIKKNSRVLRRASLIMQADNWLFSYMNALSLD